MFEVARLVARLTLEGAQTFGRDLNKVKGEFKGLGEEGRRAATDVGKAGVLIGGAILAFAGVAIAKSAQFEKAMSAVSAVTDATAGDMDKLRQAAIDAGGATVFTAEEAANAIENLSKAGVAAADIYGGALSGALSLAAAGEVDVGFAAEVAATAMTQFKLAGKDVPHIADLLAAAAGKAQGDVTDMSFALKQSGLVAAQFGLSLEETTGTLAAFASNGLLGSDAGTSFRQMLLSLANPSAKAEAELKKYNITAYDAQGQFIGTTALAGQLQTKLGGLTEETRNAALATIFGTDAIRSANVLYEEGAAGIAGWTTAVNDSGYAAKVAAERQDNLAGDLEKLGGAFDSLMISFGAGAQGPLRDLVQGVTGLVDAFAGLPKPMQDFIMIGGLVVGGVALIGGAMLIAVPKIVEFRLALQTLGAQMPGTTAALKGLGFAGGAGLSAALAVGIAAMAVWIDRQASATRTTDMLKESLDQGTGAITDYTREIVAKELAESGAFAVAKDLGISQKELTDAVLEGGDALEEYQNKIGAKNNVVDFFNGSGVAAADAHRKIDELSNGLDRSKQEFDDQAAAADGSVGANAAATEAFDAEGDAVDDVNDSLDSMIEKLLEANGINSTAIESNIAYQESLQESADRIAAITAGTEGFSGGLDINTQAGRDNTQALLDQAKASQDAAQKQFELDGDVAALSQRLAEGRQKLIENGNAMGGAAGEAANLANQVYGIPTSKHIAVSADTSNARWNLDSLLAAYQNRSITLRAYIHQVERLANGGFVQSFADGGFNAPLHFAGGGGYGGEPHLAEIARMGKQRIFNEPETEGEVYLPLAMSKRTRTEQIFERAADLFGYDVRKRRDTDPATPDQRAYRATPENESVEEVIILKVGERELARAVRNYDRSLK